MNQAVSLWHMLPLDFIYGTHIEIIKKFKAAITEHFTPSTGLSECGVHHNPSHLPVKATLRYSRVSASQAV